MKRLVLKDPEGGIVNDTVYEGKSFSIENSVISPAIEGWSNDDGWTLEAYEEPSKTVEELKIEARRQLLAKADELSYHVKTSHRDGWPYPQDEEGTWTTKMNEATAFKAAGSPVATDYPLLNLLCDGDLTVMDSTADIIIARSNAFMLTMATIEKLRLQYEPLIEAATTEAEVTSAMDGVDAGIAAFLASLA